MTAFHVVERPGRDMLGEGPLWSARERALFWVDIYGRKLNRLAASDSTFSSWDFPEMLGWVIERRNHPGFIAGLQSGFHLLDLEPLTTRRIADPEPGRPENRLNDAKADSAGRIWAGTMSLDAELPVGALYRFDPDGAIACVDTGYTITNGPALSPDGCFFYHTDSKLGRIYRFELSPDGLLSGRRVFIEFESGWGTPDGMTVDRDGGLWIAHWGGGRVSRFHDDGRLDRSIALPASQITSCTFGGEDYDRMFVTSAAFGVDEPLGGALFELDTGHRGYPAEQFGG